ncbi:MAG TPA: peptidase T, partial [Mesotoga sp.]|nr:peptidase T [Mesotoga sp.]
MKRMIDRFMRYVSVETTSSHDSDSSPTTEGQLKLAALLRDELEGLGLEEVSLDGHGYVTATLGANTDARVPVIGFVAHMDTSPDASGKDVKARIVR